MSRNNDLCITARCDVADCGGTIRFGAEAGRTRRLGSCDGCGTQYSLYAGQITRLPRAGEQPPPDPGPDHHLLAG